MPHFMMPGPVERGYRNSMPFIAGSGIGVIKGEYHDLPVRIVFFYHPYKQLLGGDPVSRRFIGRKGRSEDHQCFRTAHQLLFFILLIISRSFSKETTLLQKDRLFLLFVISRINFSVRANFTILLRKPLSYSFYIS